MASFHSLPNKEMFPRHTPYSTHACKAAQHALTSANIYATMSAHSAPLASCDSVRADSRCDCASPTSERQAQPGCACVSAHISGAEKPAATAAATSRSAGSGTGARNAATLPRAHRAAAPLSAPAFGAAHAEIRCVCQAQERALAPCQPANLYG